MTEMASKARKLALFNRLTGEHCSERQKVKQQVCVYQPQNIYFSLYVGL